MTFYDKLCILVVVVGAFHISSAQTPDYCNIDLCWGHANVHVACNASGEFDSSCSSSRRIIPITDTLKSLFVRTHNEYRNRAAAGVGSLRPAARMASMQWSDELAQLAEIRSRRCTGSHDRCRSTSTFLFAGQNIGRTSFSTSDVNNINATHIILRQMATWFNQYKSTTVAQINSYEDATPIIGAFTGMIQEKAHKIGCAIMQHNKADGRARQVTTCNYAYINVVGRPVYTPGAVASQCTLGTNTAFSNLCKVAEPYEHNIVPDYDFRVTNKIKINNK